MSRSPSSNVSDPSSRNARLEAVLCCPQCRGALDESACTCCGRQFSRRGDQWLFVDRPIDSADAAFQCETFSGSTFRGRLFNSGKRVISSEFQWKNHLQRTLSECGPQDTIIELGSGARRVGADVINIDLFPFANVDVAADITETPLRDAIADCVILDSVVEHVPDPVAVVHEAHRILKPGGRLFINCPFMLPYHGYPGHFQNFTRDGLRHLLRRYSACRVSPTFGPMTAWVNFTAEIVAVLLAGERGAGYIAVKGLVMLPIFWLKFLDFGFSRMERSHRIAGMLCAIAVK